MHLLELTLPTLAENLACDEALLLQAEELATPDILRIWEWPTAAVVVGSAGVVSADVCTKQCKQDNVPIFRRSSGGGTVLLGRGCLLYSLVLSYSTADDLTTIGCSYCYILGKLQSALSKAIDGVTMAGTSDLVLGERKFSGNSQQRKRNHLLHHGTILYDFDVAAVANYLHVPKRQPDYRANRSHQTFLYNLPITKETIITQLRNVWSAETSI